MPRRRGGGVTARSVLNLAGWRRRDGRAATRAPGALMLANPANRAGLRTFLVVRQGGDQVRETTPAYEGSDDCVGSGWRIWREDPGVGRRAAASKAPLVKVLMAMVLGMEIVILEQVVKRRPADPEQPRGV